MSDPFGLHTGWYGGGAHVGGEDELQADVMRFMAILALCLVAIFAIVQSIPLDAVPNDIPASPARLSDSALMVPTPISAPDPRPSTPAQPEPPEPVENTLPPEPLPVPAPAPESATLVRLAPTVPVSKPVPKVVQALPVPTPSVTRRPPPRVDLARERRAAPQVVPAPPAQAPVRSVTRPTPTPSQGAPRVVSPAPTLHPTAPSPTPAPRAQPAPPIPQEGFALRFENDDALMALVGAGRVGLYVVQRQQASSESWSLTTRGGRLKFTRADAPRRINEMTPHTVPADVREAFVRAAGSTLGASQVWGVTLPPITMQQIQRLLASAPGGELVIDQTAGVTLNQRPTP